MIKYYKELENPSSYVLPLVENNYPTDLKYIINKFPLSFDYNKLTVLFSIQQSINLLFKNIDIEKVKPHKSSKFELLSYRNHMDFYDVITELETIKYEELPIFIDLLNQISFSSNDLIYLTKTYHFTLSLILKIIPSLSSEWKSTLQFLEDTLQEFDSKLTIHYSIPPIETRNVILPNAWYISPIGDLYNTGGNTQSSHKETNLIYSYDHINDFFQTNYNFVGISKKLLQEKTQTIENNSITRGQIKHYLNESYDYATIHFLKPKDNIDPVSHDQRIIKIILGVISAKASYFSFFEKLSQLTNDPMMEFNSIKTLTNNELSDILVRCVGFHKIESSIEKTITTTTLNPYNDFYEYIIRGWNICVIPKIIIDREKRSIIEQDLNSLFIQKHLQRQVDKYEFEKTKQYGKIYIKN